MKPISTHPNRRATIFSPNQRNAICAGLAVAMALLAHPFTPAVASDALDATGAGFMQQQKVVADDGTAADHFGESVAISGDTAIAGVPAEDDFTITNRGMDSGAAYIYVRTGTTWTQQAKLVASDGRTFDVFGNSVAISGDTAFVGARDADVSPTSTSQGAVYVFVRSGTTWTQTQKLMAPDAVSGSGAFGTSVALEGNTAIVGAQTQTVTANVSDGAAYVFIRSGATWVLQQRLNASDTGAGDRNFGSSVALSGETAIVGARRYKIAGSVDQGAAYVFVRNGTVWTQQQKLFASDGVAQDQFGFGVGLSGETAIVGAPINVFGATTNNNAGAAYIFVRNGSVWSQQQILTASSGAVPGDEFGRSVAVLGDIAIVGEQLDDADGLLDKGSAWAFRRSGTTWSAPDRLNASDGLGNDRFGSAVALSGVTAFIGATYDDRPNGGNTEADQGSAYFFIRPSAPEVLAAVSRKVHSTAGTFNIDLPLTGAAGVECRTGGAGRDFEVVVTFATPVTVGGLSIMSRDGLATGTQSVSGAVVTVNLAAVANAQTLGITLLNVSNGNTVVNVLIPMSVLLGDTTGNGSVTASDVGQVKALSGQPVTNANFRADLNVSGGSISASDIGLVKSTAGTMLP